jgi:hypothetical protein
MLKIRAGLFLIVFFCLSHLSRAQFDSQSPYSYYGIGNPVGNILQNGFAMGGVAHSLRDSCFVNSINPASYSSVNVTTLLFGFEGNFLTRLDQGQTFRNNNVFINQFGMGIPIMHKHRFVNWGMYVGYSPYTFVGYKLSDTATVINNTDTMLATYNYTGTGGLNRLTWGNGFQLGKNFSIGVNMHYTFGISNRSRTLLLPADQGYLSSRVDEKTNVNNFSFDVGAQGFFNFRVKKYKLPKRLVTPKNDSLGIPRSVRILPDSLRDDPGRRDPNYQVVIGGTYNYGGSFMAGFEQLGIQFFSGSLAVDTFLLNPTGSGEINLPHAFGGGISLSNPGVWTVAADFNYKFWKDFRYFDQPDLAYTNSYSMHLGVQYTPKFSDPFAVGPKKSRFFKNIIYRAGGRYYSRYYSPDSKSVDEVAFTFGLGLPFGFNRTYDEDLQQHIIVSYINLGFEGGFANSRGGGLVNESFVRFNVAITLRDKWFIKRRYN